MNIKLFKTKECHYVYDVNKNNIIRVPPYVYRYLASKDKCDIDIHCKAGKWIKRMQDENQSFLPRKDLKIKYPYSRNQIDYLLHIFNLGNVYNGIDMKKYNKLVSLYSRQSEKCKDCWAANMCTRCWMHLGENTSDCNKIISTCEWALESAMEILEKNPRAIDYFSNVFGGNI